MPTPAPPFASAPSTTPGTSRPPNPRFLPEPERAGRTTPGDRRRSSARCAGPQAGTRIGRCLVEVDCAPPTPARSAVMSRFFRPFIALAAVAVAIAVATLGPAASAQEPERERL